MNIIKKHKFFFQIYYAFFDHYIDEYLYLTIENNIMKRTNTLTLTIEFNIEQILIIVVLFLLDEQFLMLFQ
jgi:hypothetical protein